MQQCSDFNKWLSIFKKFLLILKRSIIKFLGLISSDLEIELFMNMAKQIFCNDDKEKNTLSLHQKRCVGFFYKNYQRNIVCVYMAFSCFMIRLIGLGWWTVLAIFFRDAAFNFFEYAVEICYAVKTAFHCNNSYILVWTAEQVNSLVYSFDIYIVPDSHIVNRFKKPWKMIFGNIGGLRNIIKRNIFAEIFIYKSNCFLQIMNVCVTGWGIGSEICVIIVSKYINQNGNNAVSHFGLVAWFLLFALFFIR